MADDELERFKSDIALHEYAAHVGYELDKAENGRREMVMRHGSDKISIRKDADGHYVFYSFRDASDHGTIIDFVMSRQSKNMGETRKVLRLWSGTDRLPLYEPLEAAPKFDRDLVQAEFAKAKPLGWHDYLENERKIPRSVLTSTRFKGCLRVDRRGNVIFPHADAEGICGFEKRNRGFKGFADLGQKALWRSVGLGGDSVLVIAEGTIDCLSHAALFPSAATRYASFAGGLSELQEALIAEECRRMPPGSEIVSITHPDAEGERYNEVIPLAAGSLPFRVHRPDGVKDWNDALRARHGPASEAISFPAVL
ncbi:MAG: DUF3991 and TOPRIM domain-containing protein [Brevundimonas sp.]|jgi:hypothetical protein|nr:DUF3991 and TOPRIM domain-containing protein [Acidobacteriaceae bacterium]MCA3717001.1 DUF3991 and TOPRIM domain-containing protein [Brevundimonas sp.]